MSEFQKRDNIDPSSSTASQAAEVIEVDGYVIDAATSGGADFNGSGTDHNRTLEQVRQQEQWLNAQQDVIEIELEEPRLMVRDPGITAEDNSATNNEGLDPVDSTNTASEWLPSNPFESNPYAVLDLIDRQVGINPEELPILSQPLLETSPQPSSNLSSGRRPAEINANRLSDSSNELIQLGRLELSRADAKGQLLQAIEQSFDSSISAEAYQVAQQFITGSAAPEISWANFDSELIQGAYIGKGDIILLNQNIREKPAMLQQVLLEELGHWIDDQAHSKTDGDSVGDEGRRLAQSLLTGTLSNSSTTSNDQVLMQLNGELLNAELSYTTNINRPVRLDAGPRALVVIEDGIATNLGLAGLQWIEQAELDRATGIHSASDPARINQQLTIRVTGLPDPQLGRIFNGDQGPLLQLDDQLTIGDLESLTFEALAGAHGTGIFTYEVSNSNGDFSSEDFTIEVLAVNDNPQGSATVLHRVIETKNLTTDGQGNYEAISLDLQDTIDFQLDFQSGDLNQDPGANQLQSLSYIVDQAPDAAVGSLEINGAAVGSGDQLTLAQLKQLSLQVSSDISTQEASQRLTSIRISIQDDGITPTGGALSANLQINVAIAKPGGGDLSTLMNIPGFNPSSDLTADEIAQLSQGSMFQDSDQGAPEFLNPQLYGQVSKENPLYLAEIGGTGSIDEEDINYSSLNVPFMFNIPVDPLDADSYTNGGTNPTHELIYKPSLNGQFRDNSNGVYNLLAGPDGFSLSANGKWKLDLDHASYKDWATGREETLDISYERSGTAFSMSVNLVMGEHAMVASATGEGADQSTTNRGFWVKSNTEGREKDRYFKYINEFVLTSYGAQQVGKNEETGDGIFSWDGVAAKTANGQPLSLLDGTVINQSGYYDFTRREGQGDGVEFLYETINENGDEVDYIVGMRYFISNNMYGDNDASLANIRDPGSGVAVMRELGVVTTEADGVNTVITVIDSPENEASTRPVVNAESYDAFDSDAISGSLDSAIEAALQAQDREDSQGAGGGMLTASVGSDQDDNSDRQFEGDSGSGASSELTLSTTIGPFQEVAIEEPAMDEAEEGEGEGEKKGSGDDPLGNNDGDGNELRKRGLRFTAVQAQTTTETTKPVGLLESLASVEMLGTNLLDGLAIGLGLLYLLYGPGQIRSSQKPVKQWINSISGKSSRHALALFWISKDGGADQLVAAEIQQNRLQLIAQAELASQDGPQSIEQSISQVITDIKSQRGGTLLLDPRLLEVINRDPAIVKQFKNYSRSSLEPMNYSGVLGNMNQEQLQAIRSWLANPRLETADEQLLEVLKLRAKSFEERLDQERATIATSIELSLALTQLSK